MASAFTYAIAHYGILALIGCTIVAFIVAMFKPVAGAISSARTEIRRAYERRRAK
jgi:hypothetical protein